MTSSLQQIRADASSTAGRRARRRTQTREKIFRCAMELFAKRGFFATTVEDITEAADVGKGTFFNYFPSKEHMLGVLHEIQLHKVAEARSGAHAGRQSTREILRDLVLRIAEEPGRSQLLARGLLATVLSNDAVRGLMVDMMTRARGMLAEILKLGQERGEIGPGVVLEDAARAFQHLVLGTIFFWSIGPAVELRERLLASFEIYWAGLTSGPGVVS